MEKDGLILNNMPLDFQQLLVIIVIFAAILIAIIHIAWSRKHGLFPPRPPKKKTQAEIDAQIKDIVSRVSMRDPHP